MRAPCPRPPGRLPATARPVVLLTLACLLTGPASSPAEAITLNEVVALSRARLADEVIIALIEQQPPEVTLDAGTVLWLKDAGLSDPVIAALVRHARPAPPPADPGRDSVSRDQASMSVTDEGRRGWSQAGSSLFWTPPPAPGTAGVPVVVPYLLVVVPGRGHRSDSPPDPVASPLRQGRLVNDPARRFLNDGFNRFINDGVGPVPSQVSPIRR